MKNLNECIIEEKEERIKELERQLEKNRSLSLTDIMKKLIGYFGDDFQFQIDGYQGGVLIIVGGGFCGRLNYTSSLIFTREFLDDASVSDIVISEKVDKCIDNVKTKVDSFRPIRTEG